MTHLDLGPISRSELDVHIRASRSPNHHPLPEITAMTGRVELPPTAAEIAAHAERVAAREALRGGTVEPSGRARRWRPVRAVRRALLERQRGRVEPEEGVEVGAA